AGRADQEGLFGALALARRSGFGYNADAHGSCISGPRERPVAVQKMAHDGLSDDGGASDRRPACFGLSPHPKIARQNLAARQAANDSSGCRIILSMRSSLLLR